MKDLKKKKIKLIIASVLLIFVVSIFLLYFFYFYLPSLQASPSNLEECKELKFSEENAINLVFFATEGATKKYSDFLFSVEPLKENKEKFNIYYIDNFLPKCDIYKDVAILCYSRELIKKAASCPNDYIFVLKQDDFEIRSSSYQNVMSINTIHPKTVIQHELGHAFANFAEEYTPANIPIGSENCQSSCKGFYLETDGCFKECSKSDFFRSIDEGNMRTLDSDNYGKFNIFLMNREIEKQYGKKSSSLIIGRQISEIKDCRRQTYYVAVLDENGNVVGKSRQVGCPPPSPENNKFDTKLIFTDAPPSPQELIPNLPVEKRVIVGETFIPKIPSVVTFTEDEVTDKQVEIAVVTRKVGAEGKVTEETKDVLVDFSDVPELRISRKTFSDFLNDAGTAIKEAIESDNTENFGRTGNKLVKNQSNETVPNYNITESNFTSGINETRNLRNETNSSQITTFAISEISSKGSFEFLIIVLAIVIIFLLLRKKFFANFK